jgi:Fur family zinc uptake transcriptional regulator
MHSTDGGGKGVVMAMSQYPTKMEHILDAMVQKGWRITEQRKSLATLLAHHDGYLSPKDVYEQMSSQYPGMSFDTVYRNLRLLSEMNVLEQFYFNEGVKFKASCLTHHHHHFICLKCEKTITFDHCPMSMMTHIPDTFQVTHHRFEVFGYCDQCGVSSE